MTRWCWRWLIVPMLVTLGVAPAVPAQELEKELVFAGIGGTIEKAMRDKVLPLFERKTGARVTYVTGTSPQNVARVLAQRDRPTIDVVWVADLTHAQGKQAGIWEKLDRAQFANLGEVYDEFRDPDDVGVPLGFFLFGLQYNTEIFTQRGLAAPTSWRDLWRPELRGRVSLYGWNTIFAPALLAMVARVEGGHEARNIEPGFEKLRALRGHVLSIANAPAQLDTTFLQKETWITANSGARTFDLMAKGFPVAFVRPREGAIYLGNQLDVVKGAPHPRLAREFLNFMLSRDAQQLLGPEIGYGPVNRTVTLDEKTARHVPSGADRKGYVILDWMSILANHQAWGERWAKEIERR